MDTNIIILLVSAILGPVMIFATRYVAKGRSRDMTRLWFVTFIAFIVYYWLAENNYIVDPNGNAYVFALLWPIAGILAFWLLALLTAKEASPIPFFRYMVFYLVAVVFAFLLDGIAGMMSLYTYSPAVLGNNTVLNPISGLQVPTVLPFLVGILMILIYFLAFELHANLRKRKIDETSATLLLCALAVVGSGLVWGITDLVFHLING